MKKVLSLVLVIVMLCSSFAGLQITSSAADLPASGKCGKNVTYTFDASTGELVISGSGPMYTYSSPSKSPFNNKSEIIKVRIESGVTSIGGYAFYNCSGLTSVTIPDSVTSIGERAFYGCRSLTSITIPDSVTSIGSSAFYDCSSLTSITIPDSVTSIGSSAFRGCSGLTSITIGNGVTSIGYDAFRGCSGLTSINIPNSVTSIGESAFSYCNGLTSVTIGNGVTSIGRSAFYGCSRLTSVSIPDSVTSIGGYAFENCSKLTKVDISDIVAWCKISFENSMANPLFYARNLYLNGELVKDLVIPDSVTSIGSSAFRGCSGLTSITIPDTVTSIGYAAFGDCSGLTSITIGSSVASIGKEAFYNCSSLTSITIPNSVTSIGAYTFGNCKNLTNIFIPNSVTSIGQGAFWNCTNVTINGHWGTEAQKCAKSYGFAFVGPEHEHHYTYQTVNTSTCVQNGERKCVCTICDEYYFEKLPLGPHNYVSSVFRQPTCIEAGVKTFTCTMCGDSYTQSIPLVEHTFIYSGIITKASLGINGKVLKTKCSVCGKEGETQTIYAPKEIILSANTFTYSGKACKPTVTLKDSAGTVIDASNYTVAYSNNVNAGTAKVTLTFEGDYYEGSMSKSFKIAPKKLTSCNMDTAFTYSGKAIVPVPFYYKTVTKTFEGETYSEKVRTNFKKGTEYTIAVSGGHKNVGKYTATIKFCGNYAGTVKKTFEIRPKPVTKSKAAPYSTTSIKVSWGKVSGVSGYSVYRYNFQKNKWEKYKNTTSTSMVVPRISAKDTYINVRIWSYKKVGAKVYYNVSSRVHFESEHTKPNKPIVKLVNTDFENFVIKFNRVAWHQTQLSDNKAFSNKGNNICVTYRNYNSKVTATGWGSVKKYYVRSREYFYDNNGKLTVGPWSDVKSITTY